jgi:hypothetical protein
MNWLRRWLREWFGIEAAWVAMASMQRSIESLRDDLEYEKKWRIELTASLRKQASTQPARKTTVYSDYETSQQAALREFEEK